MNLPNEFKVMTFNLRIAGDHDGENRFLYRQPRIRELLNNEAPDVVGFQEVVDLSREWLRAEFGDRYELIGCGRNADCEGEGIPIMFRRDRFSLLALETFWLSDTPGIPGSRFENSDQSKCPRTTHIAILKPKGCEGFLRVINTHLDHEGKDARKKGLQLLREHIGENGTPSVLLGDFNAKPHFPEIAEFTASLAELGWADATEGLGGTFHRYGTCNPPIKIDYIYTNCPFAGSRVIETAPENGVYVSDHYVVTTTVTLPAATR